MSEDLARLADHVRELTEQVDHGESYTVWVDRRKVTKRHLTHQPSLLNQLREIAHGDSTLVIEGEGGRSKPGSTFPGSLPALQLLIAIADDTDDLQVKGGLEPRTGSRTPLEDNIRSLVGLASQDGVLSERIVSTVTQWRFKAQLLTGWRVHPWRPPVPCPICDAPKGDNSGLLVWWDRQAAVCMSCNEQWDPSTIGLLGDYVNSTLTPQGRAS